MKQICSLVKNISTAFNAANGAFKKILAAGDKASEMDLQSLYDYYRTFTASIMPVIQSKFLQELTKINLDTAYNKVASYLNPAVDIAYHISTKKYAAAFYDDRLLTIKEQMLHFRSLLL